MAENGVATNQLPFGRNVEGVLANEDGTTVQISTPDLVTIVNSRLGPTFESRVNLYTDLGWPDGAVGAVWGDSIETRRGVYVKSGATDAGSWTRTGPLPGSSLTQAQLDGKASVAALTEGLAQEALARQAIATGNKVAGDWYPSTGSFPAGAATGTFYNVKDAGVVDGQSFVNKDRLYPIIADASTTTIAGNWSRVDGSSVENVVYANLTELLASTETFRGEDAVWEMRDGSRVLEAAGGATDHDETNQAGVKFYLIGGLFQDWHRAKTAADAGRAAGLEAAHIIGRRRMDGAFFGLRDSRTLNQRTALQNAVNDSAQAGINRLLLPGGRIRIDGPVLTYYDETGNPNFPELSGTIPFEIVGNGMLGRRGYTADIDDGSSVIELTDTQADGLCFGNGTNAGGNETSGLKDLAVIGATGGRLINFDFSPKFSEISGLFVANRGDGIALRLASLWITEIRRVELYGDKALAAGSRIGRGLVADTGPGTTGGGLNGYHNITSSYFALGQQYGSEFDNASDAGGSQATRMSMIQSRYCDRGADFNYKFEGSIDKGWFEFNHEYNFRLAESCTGLAVDGLVDGSVDAQQGSIILGKASETGLTTANRASGYFRLRGCRALRAANGGGAIVRHSTNQTSHLSLEDVAFNNNGGVAILVDTGDHGGIIIGPNVDFDGFATGRRIATATFDRRFELARGDVSDIAQLSGSATLSGLHHMPDVVRCSTANANCTVQLPNNADTFKGYYRPTTFTKFQSANTLTLQSSAGNMIADAQTYVIAAGTAHKSVTLMPIYVAAVLDENEDVVEAAYIQWDIVAER